MAQGKMKVKVQVPAGAKVKQKQKKPLGLKKGARYIAPKKAKNIESQALKKALTKEIGKHIEYDITTKAAAREVKSLKILHAEQPTTSKKNK